MNGNQQSAVSGQQSAQQAGSSTVSDQPRKRDLRQSDARLEGEQDARHVMGAVPVILLANLTVVLTVICLAAVLFTVLFRGGG